jgi:tetratricopeptide (TPR) repeat protein
MGFLNNPLVFDDIYFFLAGNPEKFVAQGFQFASRWWVYYSFGLTIVHLGPELIWLRLGNLVVHGLTGLALYVLLYRLLSDLDSPRQGWLKPEGAAFLAALLFLLHPVSVYATGYLIQRTILMATLFSLLTWLAFWRGLQGSQTALWLSPVLYLLAVYSKEHAIMVPAVCVGLGVLHWRSDIEFRASKWALGAVFGLYGLIALLIVFQVKYAVGTAYELAAPEMLQRQAVQVDAGSAYVLSACTQAGLFFKYLLLWAIPNVSWMSVDMREPFVLSFTWSSGLGLLMFLLYPVLAFWLLWQGRAKGMAGMAMLAPWLLFATEISTVRLQEIFVLYRSYLWMPLAFLLVAMGFGRLPKRTAIGLGAILGVAFFVLSLDRLYSFSHRFLLWDEAARVAEPNAGKPGVTGMERIYHNRGLALYREGFVHNAIRDYDKALAYKPDYSYVYNDRGAAKHDLNDAQGALSDFDQAIRLNPTYLKPYVGRAMALEKLGRIEQAMEAHRVACNAGWSPSCLRTQ